MFMQNEIVGAQGVYPFAIGSGATRLARTLREAIEIEVESLIDMLDGMDPDPDLEPYLDGSAGDDREADYAGSVSGVADDEPSLGFADHRPGRGISRFEASVSSGWGMTDLERDDSDHEDSDHSGCGDAGGLSEQMNGDTDLGATEEVNHDLAWADADPANWGCPDGEPSLGWSENHGGGYYENQLESPRDDRENDAGDNGELDDDRELEPDDEIGTGALRGGSGL